MKPGTPPLQSIRVLDQLRERIRYMHYSHGTEQVYVYLVRFFIRWYGRNGQMQHPRDIGAAGVKHFVHACDRAQGLGIYPQSGTERASVSLP